jgi:NAD(P)-dependent dehydrogenase (short-subunit alcohol dehydrogenase family)
MSLPNFSLKDRVAVVTGGRRGIGKAIALTFAEAGADVAVCDFVVDDGEVEAVAKEIRGLGRRSLAGRVDVTKKSEIDDFMSKVVNELGGIDILVNNAGVAGGGPLINMSEEEWHRIMDINLTGAFLCSQAVLKGMVERRRGSIINIASAAGIRGFSSRNIYNISKAGVIMFTKVMARDLGKYNIRVNAIAPSIIKTDLTRGMWENQQALTAEASRIPLGRIGDVEDIAGPALLLASDASSYITGDTIIVDGGQLA